MHREEQKRNKKDAGLLLPIIYQPTYLSDIISYLEN